VKFVPNIVDAQEWAKPYTAAPRELRRRPVEIVQAAIRIAPKVKGPIQLAGFLVASVCAVAVVLIKTGGGVLGFAIFAVLCVFLVATALGMSSAVLDKLLPKSRPSFLLLMLLLFSITVVLLSGFTLHQVFGGPDPKAAKFDVKLEESAIRSFDLSSTARRYVIDMTVLSLEQPGFFSTGTKIFFGEIFVHDASKLPSREPESYSQLFKCGGSVPSCIGAAFLSDLDRKYLLIPPGAKDIRFTRTVDTNQIAQNVYIAVMLYQREGARPGQECQNLGVINSTSGGSGPLKIYGQINGKYGEIMGECYGAAATKFVQSSVRPSCS
jgi:hypothetical protein